MRTQKGYVYRQNNWWVRRWRENILENGQLVRRQLAERFEPVAPEDRRCKRPPVAVQKRAEQLLASLNNGQAKPEATQIITEFVDRVYFPGLETSKRASTIKGYKARWESQLKALCGKCRLRDFRTVDGQRVLDELARLNPALLHSTLHHAKSLLSGIFTEAIRLGYLDGQVTLSGSTKSVYGNPMRGVRIPSAPENTETYAYSLHEVLAMLRLLPDPARTIVAVAAFAGLRRSEIRGLQWPDYTGATISVQRSVWESVVSATKTKKSKAPVPVIAPLAAMLNQYRAKIGSPEAGPVFATAKKTPMNLNNTLNREILPVLNACVHCGKLEDEHGKVAHKYERNPERPQWHGWHAFRRGLGSTLHRLRVQDKTIQAILRHANVATTQGFYIKTVDADSTAAMTLLETDLNRLESVLCADCAPETAPQVPTVLQ